MEHMNLTQEIKILEKGLLNLLLLVCVYFEVVWSAFSCKVYGFWSSVLFALEKDVWNSYWKIVFCLRSVTGR